MRIRIFYILCLLVASSCVNKSGRDGLTFKESVKLDQYIVEGRDLYLQHCSNCHQKNGEGLGRLYPPLNKSDFLTDNQEQVMCLIKNGISGPIVVNGIEYNQPMPGLSELTALEIAEITTYIYNKWELKAGLFDVKFAEKALQACDQQSK